jgi:hypothetical protein
LVAKSPTDRTSWWIVEVVSKNLEVSAMTRIEYKVEFIVHHEAEETHRAAFLAQLSELGKEGWRLVAIDALRLSRSGVWQGKPSEGLPMLLMREVTA